MKHYINPVIDYVFKILFGTVENIELLIDFLNKTLQPAFPIQSVKILNPYNEREFETDKLSVVDVKAQDIQGITYHIEVQIGSPGHLPNRILYLWSRQYQKQMVKGKKFHTLKPVISIWILTANTIPDSPAFHHHFQVIDANRNKLLTDQMSIHLLELSKWHEPNTLQNQDYWPYFFKEGKHWKQLPGKLDSPQMRQAMKVLEEISDKEKEFYRYQAREDYLREQATILDELEQSQLREKAAVLKAQKAEQNEQVFKAKAQKAEQNEQVFKAKAQKAEQDRDRLMALLHQAGIEPKE